MVAGSWELGCTIKCKCKDCKDGKSEQKQQNASLQVEYLCLFMRSVLQKRGKIITIHSKLSAYNLLYSLCVHS